VGNRATGKDHDEAARRVVIIGGVKSTRQIPAAKSCPPEVPLAIVSFVRQAVGMTTNVRTFLRDFTTYKAKARRGETVRVQDRDGEYLFTSLAPRKSLVGAAKGKITLRGDLTKPTLPESDWKPSL
jgi:hypothetical protein